MDVDFWQTLPQEFEAKTYRSLYPDLDRLTDAEIGLTRLGTVLLSSG